MKDDFAIEDDFNFTEEDEETLRELRSGVNEDNELDPVTGRKNKAKKSTLNKRQLSKHEMDEFFLDF